VKAEQYDAAIGIYGVLYNHSLGIPGFNAHSQHYYDESLRLKKLTGKTDVGTARPVMVIGHNYGTRDQQEKQLQDFFQNQENRDQYQKFIVTGSGKVEPFHKELRYLVETFPYNVPHATRVV